MTVDIEKARTLVELARNRASLDEQPIFNRALADIIDALLDERDALARDAARWRMANKLRQVTSSDIDYAIREEAAIEFAEKPIASGVKNVKRGAA